MHRRCPVAVEPDEEQLGRRSSHRRWILGDDCDPGVEQIRKEDVVEADQRDLVMEPAAPQCAACADGQQVLRGKDGGRGRALLGSQSPPG